MNNSFWAKDKNNFLDHITKLCKHILKEKIEKCEKSEKNDKINSHSDKKIGRALTFDNLGSITINFDEIKNKKQNFAMSYESTCNSFNSLLSDPILSKNMNLVDDVLKLMVIGEQCVGKSFFIDKLFNDNLEKSNYSHTTSLEIKKRNIKLLEKNIQLEFWDTNSKIVSSQIAQGKKYFYSQLVYYKICDGFFLIIDPTRPESVLFIEKQIQSIIKYTSNLNFFLIANLKFDFLDYDKDFHKKFGETDKHIKLLVKKYDIKIHYINLDSLILFKNQIRKFLCISYIKKDMHNINSNPQKSSKNSTKNSTKNFKKRNSIRKPDRNGSCKYLPSQDNESDELAGIFI